MCLLLGNMVLQVEEAGIYSRSSEGAENFHSEEWEKEEGGGVKGQLQSL